MANASTTAQPRRRSADLPPILSWPLAVRFVSVVASSIGFFLPLSVVPIYSARAGSAALGGLATGALLLTTVAGELISPRIINAIGYRWSLGFGLVLLGPPTLLLLSSPTPWVILTANVLRGAGFAIVVVAGGALTALLVPAERRGEGLAVVGVVSGVTTLIALPAGVWLSARYGFDVVFIVTAAAPVLALITIPMLPARQGGVAGRHGVRAWLRAADLSRPALIFAASTVAVGALIAFLPLAVGGSPAWVAPAALLAHSAAATAAKWFGGRRGDARGHTTLLAPGLVMSAAGMGLLAFTGVPMAVLIGSSIFGLGFGILQNATLTMMYARVPPTGYGAVSAIWNASYDLGMAVGALGVGVLVELSGYPVAFALVAVTTLSALLLVPRTRRDAPALALAIAA